MLTRRHVHPIDVGKRAAQFGRERPEALAAAGAVTGLAGLFERRGRDTDTGGADGLCGALELVSCGGERRQIAGAGGR